MSNDEEYKQLTDIEHVLLRPGMYIGGLEPVPRTDYIYNFDNKKIVENVISTPFALHRMYIEILSNSTDNIARTKRKKASKNIDYTIEVTMATDNITVVNGGNPIPIKKHSSGIYIPELIFGNLRTGSNYGDVRNEAGVNGIGAKATNIFSNLFIIECANAESHKIYKQSWSNNMKEVTDPEIFKYNGKESYTKITYFPDFERFELEEFSLEDFCYFAAEAAFSSYNTGISISFNGELFSFQDEKLFKNCLADPKAKNIIYDGDLLPDKKTKTVGKIKLILVDTPNEGKELTFVNGMRTRNGGKHLDAFNDTIIKPILEKINDEQLEKAKKMMKKGKLTASETRNFKLYPKNLTEHFTIVVSVNGVSNPDFVGQTKDKLSNPIIKFEIPDGLLKPISTWKIMDIIKDLIKAKQSITLKKTDGKLTKFVNLDKLNDANNAGKKDRMNCTLFISEGDSASNYVSSYMSFIENGKDYCGILKLQGKVLNVFTADPFQISESKPITNLKKALGLKEGTDYTIPKNFKSLRYGKLVIMTDADVDGKHITCLVLLYFYAFYPSLIQIGFIQLYRTPILRAANGNKVLKFFTEAEFLNWEIENAENVDLKKWKFVYFKGLGSSETKHIREDFLDQKIVVFTLDKLADHFMKLSFDKGMENERKKWVIQYDKYKIPIISGNESVSDLLNIELRSYSFATLTRALPSVIDGFKESIRKLIYGSLDLWKSNSKPVKVFKLSAYVMDKAEYHHGDASMNKIIIKMCQRFIGSNNLPLLLGVGSFGTREYGGKDSSSPRYISVKPSPLLKYIFNKEDEPLLKYKIEENVKVEPESYFPIIPIHIINGTVGIATGFSTTIPPHNPLDVIKWYENRLNDIHLYPPQPNYVNYKGTIQPVQFQEEDGTIHEDELPSKYYCLGDFHMEDDKIIVTELPISIWPDTYRNKLKKLLENKQISEVRDCSIIDKVYFEIGGWQNKISLETLGLCSSISLRNIVCLNHEGIPTIYSTIYEIFEEFYLIRLNVYEQRRLYKISKLKEDIAELELEAKFISLVLDGSIKVLNIKKSIIVKSLEKYDIPSRIFIRVKLSRCTYDEIEENNKKIKICLDKIEILENTKPEQMWLKDLKQFKTAYIKWRKETDKEDEKNNKIIQKK